MEILPATACVFPDYARVIRLENMRASLAFAWTLGHDARASELADAILDLMGYPCLIR